MHVALQRVIVRMMYDAAFKASVYANADDALTGLDLTAVERGWLTAPDARAYSADPHLRGRALHGLFTEYPASAAIALRGGARRSVLESFFSSEAFHRCIQDGSSLSVTWGEWFSTAPRLRDRRIRDVARIELGLARLRRRQRPPQVGSVRVSERFAVVHAAARSVEVYQAVMAALLAAGADISTVAQDPAVRLPGLPRTSDARRVVLLADTGDGMTVEEPPEALGELLWAAWSGQPVARLHEIARAHGCEPPEDVEVVADLITDGLLNMV